MAFNLGDIFVTFKAKTDDLKSGVAEVKTLTKQAETAVNSTSFKAFAGQASSAFGGVANAIQGIVVKAAVLATTSSIGLGTFIKSAADLQQTSKSFEVLTGNVKVANELFAKLARYANTTPFEFPQIAKAGQILLGFGIKSSEVYKRITMLGDIAAATGADFESLALVFGQVNATGHLMGQDALQLINNKIPITSILAKKLGKTVVEVKDAMEKGEISVEMFNSALEDTTKKGGFAFHGTDILAQSLNGRLSTLSDTVLEFGRNLIGVKVDPKLGLVIKPGGIFDRFSQLVPKIGEALQSISPKIQAAFGWLVDHGNEVRMILVSIAVAFVAAKVAAIGFAIAAAANPIGLISAAIVILIGLLTYLQQRFDWIGKTLAFIQPYWQALSNFINAFIMPAFRMLGDVIVRELGPALKQLWDAVVKLWNSLQPYLLYALEAIGAVIGVVLVASILIFIGVITLMVKAISFVINIIGAVINAIAGFERWVNRLVGSIIKMYATILGNFNRLPGAIGSVINSVIGWFQQLPGRLGKVMGGIANIILAPFRAAFNSIIDLWNSTIGSISFKAPDWVPGIGGKGWGFPRMPHFERGVENFAGGWAVVGEKGPEMAYLPKGSSVYSNDKSQGMMGRQVSIYGDINIDSEADADYLLKRMDRNMQLELMGGSPL